MTSRRGKRRIHGKNRLKADQPADKPVEEKSWWTCPKHLISWAKGGMHKDQCPMCEIDKSKGE